MIINMIIYIDVIFLNNTLMTLGIIWALSHILNYKTSWWRLLLSGLVGTIYTFIVIYFRFLAFPSGIAILIHIGLNLFTAIIMIYIAFGRISKNKLLKAVGYLYLLSFIVIGTILSISYFFGNILFEQQTRNLTLNIILGLIIILLLGKFGWGIFQNYIIPDVFYVPVEIFINNNCLKLTGLVDTGNRLSDPLTDAPVIVIELEKLFKILPRELGNKLKKNSNKKFIYLIEIFKDFGWENRIRVLPFSDLGQEQGMLVGLRPDRVKINYKDSTKDVEKVILALTNRSLDEKEEYTALVHPQLLKDLE